MQMKGLLSGLAVVGAFVASAAPVVESVIVRQQWPWSDLVKVEYCLSGINNAANLSVQAWNGAEEIDAGLLRSAIDGDTIGVSDNVGSFLIDPKILFGREKKSLSDFRVKVSATDSTGDLDEVLYKIFDRTNGSCEDVTRRGLLNGRYGTIETDYAKVGLDFGVSGFNTSLADVLIWTGVTNNIAYKTSKLVMRKIPARDKSFWMGAGENELWPTEPLVKPYRQVSFTNDYYVAVFELTDGQFQCIITNTPTSTLTVAASDKMRFTNADWRFVRPVNVPDYILRWNMAAWPKPEAAGVFSDNRSSLVGNLRLLTGNSKFDLPTEALWEYACRAGTETTFNCGLDTADAAVQARLARSSANSNMNSSNYNNPEFLATWTPADGGTAVVGSYPPNAWGLYDMHGNLMEQCLDHYVPDPTTLPYYSSVDPWGPTEEDAVSPSVAAPRLIHIGRGGSYWYSSYYFRSAFRCRLFTNNANDPQLGARLCLRVD